MESFLSLLPILVLMLMSFLFSGAETAMTAASQPRMIELERQGNLWVVDVRSGIANQLTLDGAASSPIWTR